MTNRNLMVAGLLVATAIAGSAFAADKFDATGKFQNISEQRSAYRDFGRISKDGAEAFTDLHLARFAIFNADPAEAKAMIAKAQAALERAKTDDTAFDKAEADFTPPARKAAPPAGADAAKSASRQPIAWLPVDAQLILDDNFTATPETVSAIADANKSLEKGDRKGALEKLKFAHVTVSFTMALLPLDKTIADVDQAASLIKQGKYYEASAALKSAEDGMRFDVFDEIGLPQKTATADSAAPQATGTAVSAAGAK